MLLGSFADAMLKNNLKLDSLEAKGIQQLVAGASGYAQVNVRARTVGDVLPSFIPLWRWRLWLATSELLDSLTTRVNASLA